MAEEFRWEAYLRKVKRTHTSNIFGTMDNFKKFCDSFKTDGSDEALIRAADDAVEGLLRAEQTVQQLH